jgi:hypothetical protein
MRLRLLQLWLIILYYILILSSIYLQKYQEINHYSLVQNNVFSFHVQRTLCSWRIVSRAQRDQYSRVQGCIHCSGNIQIIRMPCFAVQELWAEGWGISTAGYGLYPLFWKYTNNQNALLCSSRIVSRGLRDQYSRAQGCIHCSENIQIIRMPCFAVQEMWAEGWGISTAGYRVVSTVLKIYK